MPLVDIYPAYVGLAPMHRVSRRERAPAPDPSPVAASILQPAAVRAAPARAAILAGDIRLGLAPTLTLHLNTPNRRS